MSARMPTTTEVVVEVEMNLKPEQLQDAGIETAGIEKASINGRSGEPKLSATTQLNG